MMENATLNCNEPILDEILTSQLKDVFAAQNHRPSKSTLNFIFGFAAAYETLQNDLLGSTAFMKN